MTVAKEGGGTKSGRACSPKGRTDRQSPGEMEAKERGGAVRGGAKQG